MFYNAGEILAFTVHQKQVFFEVMWLYSFCVLLVLASIVNSGLKNTL